MSDAVSAHKLRSFFFFNDTATTEIYTLSLHDALPISAVLASEFCGTSISSHSGATLERAAALQSDNPHILLARPDRKSTRLNSSHGYISYAVFCLQKKK